VDASALMEQPMDELWEPGSTGGRDDATPVNVEIGGPNDDQSVVGTRVVSLDPEGSRGTKIVDLSNTPAARKASRKGSKKSRPRTPGSPMAVFRNLEVEESGVSEGIDDLLKTLRLFYARLHRLDRWTVWALVAAFLASFLPWNYELGRGLMAGIQGFGTISAALSICAIICIYMRTARRRLSALLLLLQLLLCAGVAAVPVYSVFYLDRSDLTYGVYLTGLAAAVVLVLTLGRLSRLNV